MPALPFILVEDHAHYRASITEALEDTRRYACAGSFSTMEDALEAIAAGLVAEIALLDLGLPGMDGLQGIACLREKLPSARVLVLTAFSDREKVFAALKAGAHGYLIKTGGAGKVVRALDEMTAGGVTLDPQIAGMVLETFQRLSPTPTRVELSEREAGVLSGIARGKTRKEVAGELGLSHHTIDQYLRRAFDKLHVHSLPAAVSAAIRQGLLNLPD